MPSQCRHCGRRLTTQESIHRGFGPVCANHLTPAAQTRRPATITAVTNPGQLQLFDNQEAGPPAAPDCRDEEIEDLASVIAEALGSLVFAGRGPEREPARERFRQAAQAVFNIIEGA